MKHIQSVSTRRLTTEIVHEFIAVVESALTVEVALDRLVVRRITRFLEQLHPLGDAEKLT
jgi:hypothetical protein